MRKRQPGISVLLLPLCALLLCGIGITAGTSIVRASRTYDRSFALQFDPTAPSAEKMIGGFVASKRGKKYYPVGSAGGESLAPQNRIYFPDATSAERAGYTR